MKLKLRLGLGLFFLSLMGAAQVAHEDFSWEMPKQDLFAVFLKSIEDICQCIAAHDESETQDPVAGVWPGYAASLKILCHKVSGGIPLAQQLDRILIMIQQLSSCTDQENSYLKVLKQKYDQALNAPRWRPEQENTSERPIGILPDFDPLFQNMNPFNVESVLLCLRNIVLNQIEMIQDLSLKNQILYQQINNEKVVKPDALIELNDRNRVP